MMTTTRQGQILAELFGEESPPAVTGEAQIHSSSKYAPNHNTSRHPDVQDWLRWLMYFFVGGLVLYVIAQTAGWLKNEAVFLGYVLFAGLIVVSVLRRIYRK